MSSTGNLSLLVGVDSRKQGLVVDTESTETAKDLLDMHERSTFTPSSSIFVDKHSAS